MNDEAERPEMQNSIVATSPRGLSPNAGAQALVQRTLGEVQVAVMMAKQFPRDKIESTEKLLNACCSEKLASLAVYSYSRGGTDITGPTIRLAEAAKRAWGNMQSGWRELSRTKGHDGVGVSEVEAFAWDTENNTRESTTITVRHWRDTKKGGYALTDERDIRELLGNQAKRIERGCILNSIDGDIIEAALEQVDKTLNQKVTITPEKIQGMIAAFSEYGVSQGQIENRIQRRIDAINPALIIALTKIFNSLKDGMSKSSDWFEPEEGGEEDKAPAKGNQGVKDKLSKKDKEAAAKKAGADPETGELPNDESKKEQKLNISEPSVQKVDSSIDDQAVAFSEGCAKQKTVTELVMHRHNHNMLLNKLQAENPPKYNFCVENYNAIGTHLGMKDEALMKGI